MSGAATTTISLHVLGITDDGKLWHTRQPMLDDGSMGTWGMWEEVRMRNSQSPGLFVHAACVSTWTDDNREQLHVLCITQDAKLWYTSRIEQQDWQPFENLGSRIGGNGWNFRHVGVTELFGGLSVCVVVSIEHGDQRILHAQGGPIRWQKFEDITQPQLAGFPGSFVSVDCAYTWVGLLTVLQVCGVTQDGKLWHTIRFANPTWLPFANVQLLSTNAPVSFANVSLAQGSTRVNDLDVCAQANGILWHTQRFSSNPPHWQTTFDSISDQAGKPGLFGIISCGNVAETLHVCGVTNDGKLWHTVRTSKNPPVWLPFEDLTSIVGNPGRFVFVGVANSTPPPALGGADQTCAQIQLCIGNDRLQMQALQTQEASTSNQAAIAQMNQQIAGLKQAIASLQKQAQQHNCP